MSPRLALINAHLVDPASGLDAPGALLIEGERIADLGPRLFNDGLPPGATVIDCKGRVLAPGLVDMHAHLREPGQEHKETLATAGRAAAAGGVTTVVAMPNTKPPIDDVAILEFLQRRARDNSAVRIEAMAAITRGLEGREMCEMGLLAASGAVAFTDGEKSVANPRLLLRALAYATTFDLLIVNHPEDPALAEGGQMNSGEVSLRLGLTGISPAAEIIGLERDLRLVEATGARYHASGISTAESVHVMRRAKGRGLRASAAVAPHHIALTDAAVGDYRTFAKLSPPLRNESDRQAIVAGLKSGAIDIIASHHAPQDQEGKRQPFAQAKVGAIGLEIMLPVALELARDGHMSLIEVLRKMTVAPAELLKLDRGALRKGGPADLVVIETRRRWRYDADLSRSKSKNSPFDKRDMQGHAALTLVGGRVVFDAERERAYSFGPERLDG
ncbi:MAG: amidohydrolase family protein [Alphaproteobacteria bacterium]|nr:amidohydrolase family protein [Alphaproteobacteria bacterium]